MYLYSMKKVYNYTRFSTPEQAQGDSARRQLEATHKYAERNGFILDDSLSINDLGVSAYRGQNAATGGLSTFIDAIDRGLVAPGSVLAVESLDRLSRNIPRRAVRLLEDLVDAGITVVSLDDNQEYNAERLERDPWALMVAYMVAVRANEESQTKSRRVRAAWDEKRRKVRAGEARRFTRKAPAWLIPEGDGWAIDEGKANVIRRVYVLTVNGMGEHRIAELLNREGVAPLGRGKHWHRSSIAKLLRNRAVIGDMTPGHMDFTDGVRRRVLEEPVKGHFPAIIEEAQWCAVRAIKDGAMAPGRGSGAPLANIFSRLARCPVCGSAMTRVSKGSRTKAGKPALVCTRAKAGAGCRYVSVPLDDPQGALLRHHAQIVSDIPAGDNGRDLDVQAHKIEGTIAGLTEHLAELSEAFDASPSQHGARLIAKREAELRTMQEQADELDERRRVTSHGLIHDRAVSLALTVKCYLADSAGKDRPAGADCQFTEGEGLAAINAGLRSLFSGIVVDYPRGQLILNWRQGGETVIPYAYGFEDAERKAA